MSLSTDLNALYESCNLCPRACGVNRLKGGKGFCREGIEPRLACACLHRGEEPPLTGGLGSGAIFFSGCTLKCQSCQNRQLSRTGLGRTVSVHELAAIMLRLEERGAANINLVTGSHFLPGIIAACKQARASGLRLPLVWNTSGFENETALEYIDPYVHIYLADLKTRSRDLAGRLCGTPDYPQIAERALLFMTEKKPLYREKDALKQGVIMRHLVLPGEIGASRDVLAWFKSQLYGKALLSLMVQFLPVPAGVNGDGAKKHPSFHRMLNQSEYREVLAILDDYGIEEGFVQDPAAGISWLPDFSRDNPFPAGCADTVWHYEKGFVPL